MSVSVSTQSFFCNIPRGVSSLCISFQKVLYKFNEVPRDDLIQRTSFVAKIKYSLRFHVKNKPDNIAA